MHFQKQKLKDGRLVRLSVAENQIDSWHSTAIDGRFRPSYNQRGFR